MTSPPTHRRLVIAVSVLAAALVLTTGALGIIVLRDDPSPSPSQWLQAASPSPDATRAAALRAQIAAVRADAPPALPALAPRAPARGVNGSDAAQSSRGYGVDEAYDERDDEAYEDEGGEESHAGDEDEGEREGDDDGD